MAWHQWAILEQLPPYKVAFFRSEYPDSDVTNKVDIGPLFPLFTASCERTFTRETGREPTREEVELWMGPARFHLPPTIRWICCLDLVGGKLDRDSLEVWMAFSDRVVLGDYDRVKDWAGGLFASVESPFDTTVTESWAALERQIERHELRPVGDYAFVENFQATNHGGWDRYRVMTEIDPQPLRRRGWLI